MVDVITGSIHEKDEDVVALGTLEPGMTFRDAQDSFQTANAESRIWMVIPDFKKVEDRKSVVSLDGTESRMFGSEFKVIRHQVETVVYPNI